MYLFVFKDITLKRNGRKTDNVIMDYVDDDKIARALIGGKKTHITSDGVEFDFKKCYYTKLSSVF